jgi:hypothetical protein
MDIQNNFDIGQIVYLKHDVDQKPRMVTEIRIRKHFVAYELQCATEYSVHEEFEMSLEKTLQL